MILQKVETRRAPPQCDEHYAFRHWLYKVVEGLSEAHESKDYLATAFLLRDWVGRHATFAHKELLLQHGSLSMRKLLDGLLACEGGVWCGGVARLFSGIARAFSGLYIAEYSYGYHADNISHVTNIVGLKDGRCYNLDAYLGYHWVDSESQELLDFGELLRRIKRKEYKSIQRVDVELCRLAVAAPGDDGRRFRWLYGAEGLPEPGHVEDRLVFRGAAPLFTRLYREGSQNRLRMDEKRGGQPFDEFALDLMLVEAKLGRFAPTVSASFTEYSVMHKMLQRLIRS